MTPEQIGQLIAAFILALIGAGTGTGATLFVRRQQAGRDGNKYEKALERIGVMTEDMEELRIELNTEKERSIQQNRDDQRQIDELRGQVNLLDQQRRDDAKLYAEEREKVGVERGSFRAEMEQVQKQIDQLRRELDSVRGQLEEARSRNRELERINGLLKKEQGDCEQERIDHTETQRKLKAAEKEIDGLKRLVKKLNTPDGPEPDDAPPAKAGNVLELDGAATDARVDTSGDVLPKAS